MNYTFSSCMFLVMVIGGCSSDQHHASETVAPSDSQDLPIRAPAELSSSVPIQYPSNSIGLDLRNSGLLYTKKSTFDRVSNRVAWLAVTDALDTDKLLSHANLRSCQFLWVDADDRIGVSRTNLTIPNIPLLEELVITGKQPANLNELVVNAKHLESFSLSGSVPADQIVESLLSCNLQYFSLTDISQVPHGIAQLISKPNLQQVDLRFTPVSSEVESIASQGQELSILRLDGTLVDDKVISSLGSLKVLKRVSINETRVTESGAMKLLERLPDGCVLYWRNREWTRER